MKKAVIFSPFWRQPGHVGNNRVERFVRWLDEAGYRIVIVRAGSSDQRIKTSWGEELTVRDKLGLYRDNKVGNKAIEPRKPNRLRRWLAYWLFNPDPGVVWARVASRSEVVRAAAMGADFILSSSPPESAHIGAWLLSKKIKCRHIVDMRDGWLDEPLKPILANSVLRRWQEGRLESKILGDADTIFVTSGIWSDLLCMRLSVVAGKVVVLTNGYPKQINNGEVSLDAKSAEAGLVLVHAGRFTGSRRTQSPDLLLEPLLNAISVSNTKGVVRLVGSLVAAELEVIELYNRRFQDFGWLIECPGRIPREQLLKELPFASGLLLLSASDAAIPSKLFEYIPTGRPILVVTKKDSATWQVCEKLPQASLVGCSVESRSCFSAVNFMENVITVAAKAIVPEEYTEDYLKKVFLEGCERN